MREALLEKVYARVLCPTVCWFKDCKYRVKRLLWRYCSGCLCTNVVMISPTPPPNPSQ